MKRIKMIPLLVVLFIATVLMLPMAAGAATSDRTLPISVDSGASFTVSMTADDYGFAGSVVETLPDGFTYVDSTIPASQVTTGVNTVTFTLFGDKSFDYTVIASSIEDTYAFSGTIMDFNLSVSTIGGDTSIVVETEPVDSVDALAVRTLPASVEPDTEFTVSMTADDYGLAGMIVETLPVGFTYVDSTLNVSQVTTGVNTVTFTLIGESSFDYTVAASNTEGNYAFSGIFTDFDTNTSAVGGDTSIAVAVVPVDTGPDASSVRTLSATSVEPNVQFTVSITADDYGLAGLVIETIPAGFTYVDSTLDASQVAENGSAVTFTLVGESSFDYTVAASSTDGAYAFSGVIKDFDTVEFAVTGDTSIDVATPAPAASAVRTLPSAAVESGTEFTVGMTVADYGPVESVVETLPAGFTYVSSTLDVSKVAVSGDTVTFTLVDESSFDYTVEAASADGIHAFSGVIKNSDMVEYAVTGDTSIEVFTPAPPALAVRTLPTDPVESGTEFMVSMSVVDYGPVESVVETLPAGFTYVSSTLDESKVAVSNDTVTFTLVDESSFNYTVVASDTEGTYAFSGVIKNSDMVEYAVTGDTSIDVFVVNDLLLNEGWNFISVASELEDPSAASVLEGVSYDAFVYYNTQTGLWEAATKFEPLKGYWIHVSATDQVILEDALAIKTSGLTPTMPPSLQLYKGWNAVGSTDSIDTYSAEFVLQSIDDSYSKIVGSWNGGVYELIGYNGQSGVLGTGDVGTDSFYMSPYSGYWIYATGECELH